jgi:hypothetical protein
MGRRVLWNPSFFLLSLFTHKLPFFFFVPLGFRYPLFSSQSVSSPSRSLQESLRPRKSVDQLAFLGVFYSRIWNNPNNPSGITPRHFSSDNCFDLRKLQRFIHDLCWTRLRDYIDNYCKAAQAECCLWIHNNTVEFFPCASILHIVQSLHGNSDCNLFEVCQIGARSQKLW